MVLFFVHLLGGINRNQVDPISARFTGHVLKKKDHALLVTELPSRRDGWTGRRTTGEVGDLDREVRDVLFSCSDLHLARVHELHQPCIGELEEERGQNTEQGDDHDDPFPRCELLPRFRYDRSSSGHHCAPCFFLIPLTI